MEKINDPTEIKVIVTCLISPVHSDQTFDLPQLRATVAQAIHNALEHEEGIGFTHLMENEICISIADVETDM